MKKVPFSMEAEQSLLGSILVDQNAIRRISDIVSPEDFYMPKHQMIYRVMLDLYKNELAIDYATVENGLNNVNQLSDTGGINYLIELSELLPSAANSETYGHLVKDKSFARLIIRTCNSIVEKTYAQNITADEILDIVEDEVLGLTKKRRSIEFKKITNIVNSVLSDIEEKKKRGADIVGLSTGFYDLDKYLLGLQKGSLLILAARPSVGKSALAINLAYNVAETDKHVAIFSLEMPAEQIVQRMLASVSSVEGMKIQSGNISDDEWRKIGHAGTLLKGKNIYFDDKSGVNINEVYAKCRDLFQEEKLDLVVIDYLQLLSGSGKYAGNRVVEVSEISRKLKNLARDLNVPVIALSQLSRQVENRQDKRPNMADLRESGSIEQDADIVMFMYRDDYYNKESETPNLVEINIAKNRSGETGKVELLFAKQISLLRNRSKVEEID